MPHLALVDEVHLQREQQAPEAEVGMDTVLPPRMNLIMRHPMTTGFLLAGYLFIIALGTMTVLNGCTPAEAQWVEEATPEWVDADPMADLLLVEDVPLLADLDAAPVRADELIKAGLEVSAEDLVGLNDEELRLLRDTVFARHGFDFGDASLAEYFLAKGFEVRPEYKEADLTLVDQQNLEIIMLAEGDFAAATQQAQVVVVQQVEEISKTADSLEVLDAFLTDKEAVKAGTAPEGFEQPPLEYYKEHAVRTPLTHGQDRLGPIEE